MSRREVSIAELSVTCMISDGKTNSVRLWVTALIELHNFQATECLYCKYKHNKMHVVSKRLSHNYQVQNDYIIFTLLDVMMTRRKLIVSKGHN